MRHGWSMRPVADLTLQEAQGRENPPCSDPVTSFGLGPAAACTRAALSRVSHFSAPPVEYLMLPASDIAGGCLGSHGRSPCISLRGYKTDN